MPALDFKKVGDSYELLVESNRKIISIKLTATNKVSIKSDYRLKNASGKTKVEENVEVLKIQLQPLGGNNSKKDQFEFLGLSGDIYLYVDTVNRVVLRLSGKIDIIGNVDINLAEAQMSR